ncbi:MAG: c-type cytochrome [Methylorubrum populi]
MSKRVPGAWVWAVGAASLGLIVLVGQRPPRAEGTSGGQAEQTRRPDPAGTAAEHFQPPPESAIPDDPFGTMVRMGRDIFQDTGTHARGFVGNDLRCSNCHLDGGRLPGSAPLWAAYENYPAYRAKNRHVNTFAERLQDCFRYSMNGKAPPLGDPVLVALESYAFFLARGARTGLSPPGRGYPKLARPASLDIAHGRDVYATKCALCHGAGGEGQATTDGHTVSPPLWGARSYNWGAGMSSVANAAGFIKANMPLGQGNTLSDEEAWSVAAFIDSRERPQDPRFEGSVAETRKAHHDDPFDFYGRTVDGVPLGQNAPPFGTVPP